MPLKKIMPFLIFAFVSHAKAQTFVGTFVVAKGDVKILKLADASSTGPFLMYEEQKYSYTAAKIGSKVNANDIVQSGTNGRGKIAFSNGDYFNIGPSSSLSMPVPGEDKSKPATLNLFYGKMRSLISKKGPRNNLEVKTPSAVAGVRGTDFYVRHTPVGSKLSVLRGEVLVSDLKANSKPVSVKKGFSAKLKKDSELKVSVADKQELVEIQGETAVRIDKKDLAKLNEETKKEVQSLNEKTSSTTLEDIKEDDPALYDALKNNKNVDTSEISAATVAKLYDQAPGKIHKKPTQEDLDAIGEELYDKYFKPSKTE